MSEANKSPVEKKKRAKFISSGNSDWEIDVRWFLDKLLAGKHISQQDYNVMSSTPRAKDELKWHPIQIVAKYKLQDMQDASQLIDTEWLTNWLAKDADVEQMSIDPMKVNVAAITAIMSYKYADRHGILALVVGGDEVVIGSAQPFNMHWKAGLSQTVGDRHIRHVLVNPEQLERYRLEFYNLSKSIQGATGADQQGLSNIGNFEQLLELGKGGNPDANDQHIVNIVDWILQYAFEQRASDIHLEPRRDVGRMRFRIDGVLHDVYELPAMIMAAVTSRLKILGRLNVAEKRRPQDGRIKTVSTSGDEIELRLSTMPTAFGEKMVMRIFDPEVLVRSFEQLGLANEDFQRWEEMSSKPHGIVYVTGPTGSGKTTTLYSTLKGLATSEVNVCTLEDPIEMVEPAFNQMQIQENIDVSFAEGVRSLLRQDPDIIMIGETRDLETAEIAVQASLTGHLVMSTLHTNDAPSAITRLLDLGLPHYLISASVIGIMAQRLVRTLCQHCKAEAELTDDAWKELTQPWKMKKPAAVFEPVGCKACRNTGYSGRMGVYEILPMSPALQKLIGKHGELNDIRRLAYKEGMYSLRLSGAKKIAAGLTTVDEVMRVTPASHIDD